MDRICIVLFSVWEFIFYCVYCAIMLGVWAGDSSPIVINCVMRTLINYLNAYEIRCILLVDLVPISAIGKLKTGRLYLYTHVYTVDSRTRTEYSLLLNEPTIAEYVKKTSLKF